MLDLKVLAFGEKEEQLCDYFVAKNEGRNAKPAFSMHYQ